MNIVRQCRVHVACVSALGLVCVLRYFWAGVYLDASIRDKEEEPELKGTVSAVVPYVTSNACARINACPLLFGLKASPGTLVLILGSASRATCLCTCAGEDTSAARQPQQ